MGRSGSGTRDHIIDTTLTMISESESHNVRIFEVAQRSNVGVPTIYYYFESRTQLIAEAQLHSYSRRTENLHQCLTRAEEATGVNDEAAFWSAIGENLELAWAAGQGESKWDVVKLLLDVWADPGTRERFTQKLETQFQRWINAVERAKDNGWIIRDLDSQVLISTYWSASIGQAVIDGSTHLNPTGAQVCAFFIKAARTIEST
ncbi:MAG: TetR/AcrR family transcriptional regulator [Acidimicrobiales bacterium]